MPNNTLTLPHEINILSWNYDNQLEISYSKFIKSSDAEIINSDLQVFPLKEPYIFDPSKFCVMKLNGSAGGSIKQNQVFPFIFDFDGLREGRTDSRLGEVIENILIRYHRLLNERRDRYRGSQGRLYPAIFYSWDDNEVYDKLRAQACEIVIDSKILVIIGYSFPTFNRKVDRLILEKMEKLEKIYLQTKKESIIDVSIRIRALLQRSIPIEPIEGIEEFYIPFEF